jgi:hypothetical protein
LIGPFPPWRPLRQKRIGLDLEVPGKVRGQGVGGGTRKNDVGPLQRPRHEAGANVFTVKSEPELDAGQEAQGDADAYREAILQPSAGFSEADHLSTIPVIGKRTDGHQVILDVSVVPEMIFTDPRADGFYNLAVCGYNEGCVTPPSVATVPTEEPKSLPQSDEPAEEGVAVGENEVSGLELADSSALSGAETGKRGNFGCGHGTKLPLRTYRENLSSSNPAASAEARVPSILPAGGAGSIAEPSTPIKHVTARRFTAGSRSLSGHLRERSKDRFRPCPCRSGTDPAVLNSPVLIFGSSPN